LHEICQPISGHQPISGLDSFLGGVLCFLPSMYAALRYAMHEFCRDFLIFVRGEDFITMIVAKMRIAGMASWVLVKL
jgi:F0F1-type ATP synthase assembly protein I